MENTMRELTFSEVEEVSGGVVWTPWIAGAVGIAFLTRIASDNWWGEGPRGPIAPALPPPRR